MLETGNFRSYSLFLEIEFDPAKDVANVIKHGVSLARTVDLAEIVVVEDARSVEPRLRLYGRIDGLSYCAAVAMRGSVVRIISLRRAHRKELRRHGL